jgi:hypothetical protein
MLQRKVVGLIQRQARERAGNFMIAANCCCATPSEAQSPRRLGPQESPARRRHTGTYPNQEALLCEQIPERRCEGLLFLLPCGLPKTKPKAPKCHACRLSRSSHQYLAVSCYPRRHAIGASRLLPQTASSRTAGRLAAVSQSSNVV